MQDEMKNIYVLGIGAAYTTGFTVFVMPNN